MVSIIPLSLMLFYMVNSSKAIHEHTRTQDAADMVALAHASEAARSLNTLSMNQVSMTQAFASGVTGGSLLPIIAAHEVLVAIAMFATFKEGHNNICDPRYSWIPKVGKILYGVCMVPTLTTEAKLLANGLRMAAILITHDPLNALNVASKSINALNAKNKALLDRFPEAASISAKQVAQSAQVTTLYFDDNCKDPDAAATCKSASDKERLGMNLPVSKNIFAGYPRFCAALFFGTGGADLGSLGLGGVTQSFGASLFNGSYTKRGFPTLKGPMLFGGDNKTQNLRDFVSLETKVGDILHDFWRMMDNKSIYDGLLGAPIIALGAAAVALQVAEAVGLATDSMRDAVDDLMDEVLNFTGPILGAKSPEEAGGINYPYEQKEERNVYKDLVNVRTANMCIGDPVGKFTDAIGMSGVSQIASVVTGALPNIDVYHPMDEDVLPTIQPKLTDYSDAYKPLAFVFRKPNGRWSPSVFKNPTKGFHTYSEALVYNPDEIGLYSQNWQARLIPAEKMANHLSEIVTRMKSKAPSQFKSSEYGLIDDLTEVQNDNSWGDVVAK
jgi:hypothetical protein